MQRIANPWTSVRFRYAPPLTKADYDIYLTAIKSFFELLPRFVPYFAKLNP